jgi:hypothetical protein
MNPIYTLNDYDLHLFLAMLFFHPCAFFGAGSRFGRSGWEIQLTTMRPCHRREFLLQWVGGYTNDY